MINAHEVGTVSRAEVATMPPSKDALALELFKTDPEIQSHILAFIPPHEEVELRARMHALPSNAFENTYGVQVCIEEAIGYLESPTIVDDFATNDDRSEWRVGMHEKYKAEGRDINPFYFYNRNKLRANSLAVPLSAIDILQKRYVPDLPEYIVKEKEEINALFHTQKGIAVDADGEVVIDDLLIEGDIPEWVREKVEREELVLIKNKLYDFLSVREKLEVVERTDNLVRETAIYILARGETFTPSEVPSPQIQAA